MQPAAMESWKNKGINIGDPSLFQGNLQQMWMSDLHCAQYENYRDLIMDPLLTLDA